MNGGFKRQKHVKYFLRCLDCLPAAYVSMDTSRMTVLFFCLSGLDLLNALDDLGTERKQQLIDWIYSMQVLPASKNDSTKCGFRGGSFLGSKFSQNGTASNENIYEGAHVAMTYTALSSLVILGDDLSKVDRAAVISALRTLQKPDGSFFSTHKGSENDMRFLYCASCISYILQDWSGVDQQAAINYVRNSTSYDHGISQGPQLESHGGSTFCAIASLVMMGRLRDCYSMRELSLLRRWCLTRQKNGFQGRPNKPVDTCYSFWVGASLKMLDGYEMIDKARDEEFILSTQDSMVGGFSKWPDTHSDAMHSYLGLCALSMKGSYDLARLYPALTFSERAYQHLKRISNIPEQTQ